MSPVCETIQKAGISLLLPVPVRVLASIVRPGQNWGLNSPHGARMCCIWGRDGLRVSCLPPTPALGLTFCWGGEGLPQHVGYYFQVLTSGFEPVPLALEDGILTTRLLEKSFLIFCYPVTWSSIAELYVSQSPLTTVSFFNLCNNFSPSQAQMKIQGN